MANTVSYTPSNPPQLPDGFNLYLQNELKKISRSVSSFNALLQGGNGDPAFFLNGNGQWAEAGGNVAIGNIGLLNSTGNTGQFLRGDGEFAAVTVEANNISGLGALAFQSNVSIDQVDGIGPFAYATSIPVDDVTGLGVMATASFSTNSAAFEIDGNSFITVANTSSFGTIPFTGNASTVLLGNGAFAPINAIASGVTSWNGETGIVTYTPKAISVRQQVFTSSGTYTPTSGMVFCIIEACAGGGGGGAANGTNQEACSGGGGGGGLGVRAVFSAAAIGSSQVITVGSPGAGGTVSSSTGGSGGTTTVGSLISVGGGVGGGGSNSGGSPFGVGGAGGSTCTVTGQIGSFFQQNGGTGGQGPLFSYSTTGFNFYLACGLGGGSMFSPPSPGTCNYFQMGGGGNPPLQGPQAAMWGGGGGGGMSGSTTATANGGAGRGGIVIITEFILT